VTVSALESVAVLLTVNVVEALGGSAVLDWETDKKRALAVCSDDTDGGGVMVIVCVTFNDSVLVSVLDKDFAAGLMLSDLVCVAESKCVDVRVGAGVMGFVGESVPSSVLDRLDSAENVSI
jgi:hypothetical protein